MISAWAKALVAVLGLLYASIAVPARAGAREPRFELQALGVLGGDVDTNLSSYLLGLPGQPRA